MKVLLLDTSFSAQPIYDSLSMAGHEVWVMGNRATDLLARRAGRHWIEEDYSQVERVEKSIDDLGIERVVPGCTDVSIETCVSLRASKGITDSPETNSRLNNKQLFRDICSEMQISAPQVISIKELPRKGKIICKPVDSFSGQGISVLDGLDMDAIDAAVNLARTYSRSSEVVIEEFIDGDLYSCSGFIVGGELTERFYVKEGSSANPFAVDTSFISHDIPAPARTSLEYGLGRLAKGLQLSNGLLHTQFILTKERAWVIEICRRCPGDLYSLLIEYSTGFPYATYYASFFAGANTVVSNRTHRHILRHTVTTDERAVFGGLRFRRPVPMLSFFPLQALGHEMLEKQRSRCGILFCEADSTNNVHNLYESFLQRRVYRLN